MQRISSFRSGHDRTTPSSCPKLLRMAARYGSKMQSTTFPHSGPDRSGHARCPAALAARHGSNMTAVAKLLSQPVVDRTCKAFRPFSQVAMRPGTAGAHLLLQLVMERTYRALRPYVQATLGPDTPVAQLLLGTRVPPRHWLGIRGLP